MSEQFFQILINGKLIEGMSEEQAKQNMAALFKVAMDKIEPMFSGRKLVIKKGLNKETAIKYKTAINRAGMLAAIRPMALEFSLVSQSMPAESVAPIADLANVSLAPVGSIVDESAPPVAPDIDTRDLVMAEVGNDLDDTPTPIKPDINTSQFSVGAVGENMAEPRVIAEPDIDISKLSAADVGSDVAEAVVVPDADIDIGDLSMAAVGENVMDHPKVAPANIDVSRLSLNQENQP